MVATEVVDLTRDEEEDEHARRAARRAAKRRRRSAASADEPVIDLRGDDDGGGAGEGGGVAAPFTCGVCFCESEPRCGLRLSCSHVYCRDCLAQHVRTQVDDGLPDADGVRCPEPACREPLTGADVAAAVGKGDGETFARFGRLALDKLIMKQPDSMGCCPSPGCPFVFEWDAANRKLDCPLCGKRYCVYCKTDWHAGRRCEERGSADDAAFVAAARKGRFKTCPRCRVWVEKADGCDNMVCRCGTAFCYKCGTHLARSHAPHKCASSSGVPFYRRRW